MLRWNKILIISRWVVEAFFFHDVLVWFVLLVIFSWLEFDVVRYPWSNRMDTVVFLSLWVGELVPMYVLVSLDYSLRHIFTSSLYVCLVETRASHNQLKHWSARCYIVCRVFMFFASLPWVSVHDWFFMSSWFSCWYFGWFTYWLGPKIEHLKGVLMTF